MGRRKKGKDIHGWVNFDKPAGMTSTQAVGKVRWLFDAKKAGHAGTLDPLASGVLPIALGEATKTVPFLQERGKTYQFTVKWGEQTSTLDAEGDVIATSDSRPSEDDIRAALSQFTGDIEQVPPKYSAIKVDGERAYDLARDGEDFELPSRPVTVRRLELVSILSEDEATFEMDCGKGTYVRSIARDLALALGTVGHVTALRRTRVGPFCEKESISLEVLEDMVHKATASEALAPVETALDDIPVFAIDTQGAFDLRQGRAYLLLPEHTQHLRSLARDRMIGELDASRFVLAMDGDTAVALCDARAGRLYPKRVFQLNDTN